MKSLLQKILTISSIIIALFITVNSLHPTPTYAFEGRGGSSDEECAYLLGMVSWDCNVKIETEEDLKNNIWIIVSNIATDLSILAAYLIVGYVIYGGYLYLLSNGDASKISSGKKTLTHAFIGLAIVMLANAILNTIRIALGGVNLTANCLENENTADCVSNVDEMVIGAVNWTITVVGLVALIFVVYGGILYITSSGDSGKIKKAKDTILYSLIGLTIVALAWIITNFVSSTIRDANESTSLLNETIISKEVNHHETYY